MLLSLVNVTAFVSDGEAGSATVHKIPALATPGQMELRWVRNYSFIKYCNQI